MDPRHPLYRRRFRVIRRLLARGGNFPASYEVGYGDTATLLIPISATEQEEQMENRTKLSVEALHELISVAGQLEGHVDQSGGSVGDVAAGIAAPGGRRGRRGAGGDVS